MSKDLLKEAIADAKAVRETAIANAKLALEEAFTPKLQSMLSAKIQEEEELEETELADEDTDAVADETAVADDSTAGDVPDDSTEVGVQNDDTEDTGSDEPQEETYEEGEEIDAPDGNPDNPGAVIGYKTVRTGQKENFAISPGISLSWNNQLDRQSIKLCKQAASTRIALLQAAYEDKRLSYELGRLKICAELLEKGVRFKAGTKYAVLCADVERVNPPGVLPEHRHTISYPGNATSNQ